VNKEKEQCHSVYCKQEAIDAKKKEAEEELKPGSIFIGGN